MKYKWKWESAITLWGNIIWFDWWVTIMTIKTCQINIVKQIVAINTKPVIGSTLSAIAAYSSVSDSSSSDE